MAFAGFRLIELQETDSTNRYAADIAAQGDCTNTLIIAHTQTGGKGRHGNHWISPAGNLYASYLITDQISLQQAGQMSLVVACALLESFSVLVPHVSVALKWPNDILVDGGKISGILLETTPLAGHAHSGLIIGIGVNLVHKPRIEGRKTASLAEYSDILTPKEFLAHFHPVFTQALSRFLQEPQFFADNTLAGIRSKLKGVGEPIAVRCANKTIEGHFEGIDDQGCLILVDEYGKKELVTAGEVFFKEGEA